MKQPFRPELPVLLLLTLSASAATQTRKLNPQLAQPVAGRVTDSAFTPDGSLAVYRADQDVDERYELYSAPADGSGPPIAISGALAPSRDVEQGFSIRADGTRVVYRSDQETDGVIELYSAPTDASAAPVRLNAPLVSGHRVEGGFALSPDGAWVVYRADQDQDDVIELYSVPLAGGASPVKLNAPLSAGQDVSSDFEISPDGDWVVFIAFDGAYSGDGLFRAPIDGSAAPSLLSDGLLATDFAIAAATERVAFRAITGFAGFGLYSVPLDGSASPTDLAGALLPGHSVTGFDSCMEMNGAAFRVSPDGTRVVYRANQHVSYVFELYSVPTDGSANPTKLIPGTMQSVVPDYEISPDGARVVYRTSCDRGLRSVPLDASAAPTVIHGPAIADFVLFGERAVFRAMATLSSTVFELFSAPLDGSLPAVRLNTVFPSGGTTPLGVSAFRVSPDGSRVAYAGDHATPTVLELFSAPLDASAAPLRLHAPFASFADVETVPVSLAISADSSRVLYRADADLDQVVELHSAPLATSASAVKLNAPFPPGPTLGDVQDARIAPGGAHVVYLADQVSDEVAELYSVAIGGAFTVTRLGPVDEDEDVQSFAISPDGGHVVFREANDLYTVPIDGSASAIQLDTGGLPGANGLSSYLISPDSGWIVFTEDLSLPGDFDLFAARIDGSESRICLNGDQAFGGDVAPDFRISPDGTRVVYRANERIGRYELFSVLTDGSASPQRLSPALVAGGNVMTDFEISPDGMRVVYRADQITNEIHELFSVPIDDGAPPVRLNGPIPAGRNVVTPFQISPDSSRVVYRADADSVQLFELYSAPLDASSAAVKLSGTPPFPENDIEEVQVSPDSTRAVYLHGTRLFSAPLDGSASPVRLDSGALSSTGAFLIDAGRVVFQSVHQDTVTSHLFSVPIGGGIAPIQLSASTIPYSQVDDLRLSPGGRAVLYSGNHTVPGCRDLYRVPLDGHQGPEQLSHSLASSSHLVFDVSPNGRYTIYVRPEDAAGVYELYLRLPTPGQRSAESDAPTRMGERPR